jgi:MFS family permease
MASNRRRQSPVAEPGFFYGYVVAVASLFILVAAYGAHSVFGIFFKPMSGDFGWTRAMTSGAVLIFWVVHGLMSIVIGRFNDRFGPRVSMTICGSLLGAGYILMSQMSAVWQLYLLFGVMIGVGIGGSFVSLASTVARWFVKRRTVMTGIVVSGSGVGQVIMSPLASYLIYTYNWRVAIIILGGAALVVIVILAQLLRRDPAQKGLRPYGAGEVAEPQLATEPRPPFPREAIKSRPFWVLVTMIFCLGYCLSTIMVHLVPYITDLEITAASAASIFATMGGMGIIGRVVLGGAADRIGNKKAFVFGFALMALVLLWLIPATTVWSIYLFAIVFGVASGGCVASESPLVATLFGLKSHGLLLGFVVCGFSIGAAVGPFVTGYIFDIDGSYRVAFLICAFLAVTGLILSAILRPPNVGAGPVLQVQS